MDPRLIIPRQRAPGAPMNPPAFFQAVQLAFERACQVGGQTVEHDYQIGGFRVRLRFAGQALVPYVTPALAHLAAQEAGEPDLTIGLWDTGSTGAAPPAPQWDYEDFGGSGLMRKYTTDHLYTFFQLGANALSLVDTDRNLALYWVKTTDSIPYWDVGAPLRAILSLWLNRRGRVLIHAGAVGLPDGGVLLAGSGGSGKSNTALSTLTSELFYAGDDFTLLALDPQPSVFSLYSTGKMNAADLPRLPFLERSISNKGRLDTEKALFFLRDGWSHRLLAHFPLKAVLLPRITGERDSQLRRAGAAEGLNALAPSTFDLAPAVERDAFTMLVQLFRLLPSYHLDLGTDPGQPAQLILRLLRPRQEIGAPPAAGPAPARE